MPSYVTRDDLRRMGRGVNADSLQRKFLSARARRPEGATFLSHSSQDDELMPVVVEILENHGAQVYLDTKDPTLSTCSGRGVAIQLRSRIKSSKKFVVFVSDNVKDSKWVPWELGVSDGYKNSRNTAIFPTVEKSYETAWLSQEYLGAYDRIVWGALTGYSENLWMVWNQDENTACTLAEWLAR